MGQQQQNGSSGKSIRTCSLGCWNGCLISRVPLKSGEKRSLRASKWRDSLGESKDTATKALNGAGLGVFHLLEQRPGLADALNERLHLLKRHVPYFESDHILNLTYNLLAG